MTTAYHSKYYANALTMRFSSEKLEKLSESLLNATVDLNPHQVEAAVFAFHSPFSKGAILADEVGLGKTIEAGLVMSQLWAERKQRILVIVPTPLRTQWRDELRDKFHIESQILDATTYRKLVKDSKKPFEPEAATIICSYQFSKNNLQEIQMIAWDLIVIDEAHRLRNVYKRSNKIARALLEGLAPFKKILLTATPLQNNLLELYGLSKFIDPQVFGDERAFKSLVSQMSNEDTFYLQTLRDRLQSICQRTLRRQVAEYVPFTTRVAITQDFMPYDDELLLYDQVSEFLRRPDIVALGGGQQHLITMVFRKLLASSSFAIGETLTRLMARLTKTQCDSTEAACVSDELENNYETISETAEEWSEEEDVNIEIAHSAEPKSKTERIADELQDIKQYQILATSITNNAKGDALLVALRKGFGELAKLGALKKAVIFTESKRTQAYLRELLENNNYSGQLVTINGTNDDDLSQAIYKQWLIEKDSKPDSRLSKSAEIRTALVEYFRSSASILIATEAGAEGLNLQFASLVVNFDLPWNPQRIEQRIGRCHRYGQKHDVVVINFINRKNAADVRVFELLSQKFKLFEGIFGTSDDVLGAIESGVDFEKRVSEIYQSCRTEIEINQAFNNLQTVLEVEIAARFEDTRRKLLEHFDEQVHERLRINRDQTLRQVSKMEEWLWNLTVHELRDYGSFDEINYSFTLQKIPEKFSLSVASADTYSLARKENPSSKGNYRLGHALAQQLIQEAKNRPLELRQLYFDYGNHPTQITSIASIRGQAGLLKLTKLTISGLETEDHLLCTAVTDDGELLEADSSTRLLSLKGEVMGPVTLTDFELALLAKEETKLRNEILDSMTERQKIMFEQEVNKLDGWADDLKQSLEAQLAEIDSQVRNTKRQSQLAIDLDEKLALRKLANELERRRNRLRQNIFAAHDDIEQKKDEFISTIEKRLIESIQEQELFTIRWRVV